MANKIYLNVNENFVILKVSETEIYLRGGDPSPSPVFRDQSAAEKSVEIELWTSDADQDSEYQTGVYLYDSHTPEPDRYMRLVGSCPSRNPKKLKPSALIFFISTALSLFAYNGWQLFEEGSYAFEKMMSVAIVGWLWAFHLTISVKRNLFKISVWVVMWWAIMNSCDEIFGDPLHKTWHEYLIALFGVFTGWIKYKNINVFLFEAITEVIGLSAIKAFGLTVLGYAAKILWDWKNRPSAPKIIAGLLVCGIIFLSIQEFSPSSYQHAFFFVGGLLTNNIVNAIFRIAKVSEDGLAQKTKDWFDSDKH